MQGSNRTYCFLLLNKDLKMKKIVLIEPSAPGFHIFSRFHLPRLGLPIFASLLKNKGIDVTIYNQDLSPVEWTQLFEADLVGISTITSTAPEAYRIISKIKSYKPELPVVIGGPHVTFLPDEALTKGADFVLRGEAEKSFMELIDWYTNEQINIQNIKGLSYKIGNKFIHNPPAEYQTDLDQLPFPDFTLIKNYKKISNIIIQTSRGCPFDCKFCSVIKMFGQECRFHSIDYTIENIKYQMNIFPKKPVFFYDDNFFINKERSKLLLERIISENLDLSWSAQVRIEIGFDIELLNLMKKSGCTVLYIGFESINEATLNEYNKRQNIKRYSEAINNIHKHHIRIHGMFVLGSDSDTINTASQTAEFSLKNKLDTVQFMILTPLPGTDTFYELQSSNRILTQDWSLYDAHHVVFLPKRMTPLELQISSILDATPKFYSKLQALKRAATSLFSIMIFLPSWKIKFQNFILTAYARKLIKKWKKANIEWFNILKTLEKQILNSLNSNIIKSNSSKN